MTEFGISLKIRGTWFLYLISQIIFALGRSQVLRMGSFPDTRVYFLTVFVFIPLISRVLLNINVAREFSSTRQSLMH